MAEEYHLQFILQNLLDSRYRYRYLVDMKVRPQIPLRFRDDEQMRQIRSLAEKAQISINEWMLRAAERVTGKGGKS